jgi:hypothetical protein
MLRPIAIATAVAGALDILWAMILTMTVGKGDIPAMLRLVASGPFGDAAKDWGTGGALLGLLVHFTLMAIMATIFVMFVRARPQLLDTPWLTALGFGLITYFAMNWVVVPLRFGTPLPPKPLSIATQLFAHLVLVAIPFVFITARTLQSSAAARSATA